MALIITITTTLYLGTMSSVHSDQVQTGDELPPHHHHASSESFCTCSGGGEQMISSRHAWLSPASVNLHVLPPTSTPAVFVSA